MPSPSPSPVVAIVRSRDLSSASLLPQRVVAWCSKQSVANKLEHGCVPYMTALIMSLPSFIGSVRPAAGGRSESEALR
jgi:hypothetical protein